MDDKEQKSYERRRDILLTLMRRQTDQWLKDDAKVARREALNPEPDDPLPNKRGRKPKEAPKPTVDLNKPRNKFFNFD